jgi:hypothetical protein
MQSLQLIKFQIRTRHIGFGGVWAGVDKDWEQEKLETRKMLEKPQNVSNLYISHNQDNFSLISSVIMAELS